LFTVFFFCVLILFFLCISYLDLQQPPQGSEFHRVKTMPSWTVLVPMYNETIIYSVDDLKRPENIKKQGVYHIDVVLTRDTKNLTRTSENRLVS